MRLLSILLVAVTLGAQSHQRMVLLSVDGLDHRYLRDCDKLDLKIPNIRRLMREGSWADGVVGEVPTITWPAHTTILTGVPVGPKYSICLKSKDRLPDDHTPRRTV